MTGLGPLANGQTAASAKKHAQKSCNFCWNWIFVGAIPRAQKSTTFAGIAFLLSQFRERKSRATFAGIAFLLSQFRERKSRATFAGIAWCADRMPVQRRRPAPGLSAAPAEPPGDSPAGASAKKHAKVVQLLLELLFCCRNSASAKVVQLLLELLGVLIACPCTGADRRPAFRPPPRSREAKPNWRERKKTRKSRATFAGIAFLLSQFRERKSRATFAGIAFLLSQFRERKSRATFAGIALWMARNGYPGIKY